MAPLVDRYPKTASGFVHREYVAARMGLTVRSMDDVRPRLGWVVSGSVIRQSRSSEILRHDYRATGQEGSKQQVGFHDGYFTKTGRS